MASDEANSDLESFRQQWLSDLRSREPSSSTPRAPTQTLASFTSTAQRARSPVARRHKATLSAGKHQLEDEDHDYVPSHSFDDAPKTTGRTLIDEGDPSETKKLVSALDHYEEAMEKEAQGNMGDSLHLYRKAYRMDHGVDRRYREKYFPAGTQKPKLLPTQGASTTTPSTSALAVTAPNTSTEPSTGAAAQVLPVADLIASFASLQIEPLAPEVEGAPPRPCPIASLPDELLIHILDDVASFDVGDFARLSLVCKRFAYLVSHEQRVWKGVCEREKFGFQGMVHWWRRGVEWEPLEGDLMEEHGEAVRFVSRDEVERRHDAEKLALTLSLVPATYPTWRAMFRSRPRVRFNGCYISTVNYVRTGVLSTNQATWGGAPIHIVTYYRYLRMFRDGTCISLLTTSEPADVVHNLTKELLEHHRESSTSGPGLPSQMMKHALRGRWRLSSPLTDDEPPLDSPAGVVAETSEGDLFIETEGVGAKYMYRMDLSLRSAGKHAARNNKLVWRGFYSYNKLTDDWGEFHLKNDKPFFWSRVKSYGFGK